MTSTFRLLYASKSCSTAVPDCPRESCSPPTRLIVELQVPSCASCGTIEPFRVLKCLMAIGMIICEAKSSKLSITFPSVPDVSQTKLAIRTSLATAILRYHPFNKANSSIVQATILLVIDDDNSRILLLFIFTLLRRRQEHTVRAILATLSWSSRATVVSRTCSG